MLLRGCEFAHVLECKQIKASKYCTACNRCWKIAVRASLTRGQVAGYPNYSRAWDVVGSAADPVARSQNWVVSL